jgi:2-polyprenyl-3-methyl-5-hydroxy-6-metoxy-1,4-benzoquinol methylase
MATPTESRQPTPELFFQTLSAYQRTAALKAAIELEIFTRIAEGAETAAALAQKCSAAERGVRILCDFLVVIGFLTKTGNRYGLTPDSAAFLDRKSPKYIGSAAKFMASPALQDNFKDLAAAVRKGGSVAGQTALEAQHPMWIEFARSMAPLMEMPAQLIATMLDADSGKKWKVLDIAAGHGVFGITLAKRNPNAGIVAVDWPNVLEVAKENAQAAGVANRYRTLPGSAFDVEFGTGYDVVLLTNILHHFDMPSNETLLRKVHAALAPEGRAVALEFIPNEDRVSPPIAATFSLTMLGNTPGGEAYPFSDYQRMFGNAGFSRSELRPLPPSFEQIVIGYK